MHKLMAINSLSTKLKSKPAMIPLSTTQLNWECPSTSVEVIVEATVDNTIRYGDTVLKLW